MPLADPPSPQLVRRGAFDPEFERVLRMAEPGPALDGALTFPACRRRSSPAEWFQVLGTTWRNTRRADRASSRRSWRGRRQLRRAGLRAGDPVAGPRTRRLGWTPASARSARHDAAQAAARRNWPGRGANAGWTKLQRVGAAGHDARALSRVRHPERAFPSFPCGCCCRGTRIGNGRRPWQTLSAGGGTRAPEFAFLTRKTPCPGAATDWSKTQPFVPTRFHAVPITVRATSSGAS